MYFNSVFTFSGLCPTPHLGVFRQRRIIRQKCSHACCLQGPHSPWCCEFCAHQHAQKQPPAICSQRAGRWAIIQLMFSFCPVSCFCWATLICTDIWCTYIFLICIHMYIFYFCHFMSILLFLNYFAHDYRKLKFKQHLLSLIICDHFSLVDNLLLIWTFGNMMTFSC